MPSWIQRMGALFGGRAAAPVVTTPPTRNRSAAPAHPRAAAAMTQPPKADASIFAESVIPDPQVSFFEWLLGTSASLNAPLLPNEHHSFARLDAVLAVGASRAELLPRAIGDPPTDQQPARREAVGKRAGRPGRERPEHGRRGDSPSEQRALACGRASRRFAAGDFVHRHARPAPRDL